MQEEEPCSRTKKLGRKLRHCCISGKVPGASLQSKSDGGPRTFGNLRVKGTSISCSSGNSLLPHVNKRQLK